HPLGGPVMLEATVDDPRRSVVPAMFEVHGLDGELVERRSFDVTRRRRFDLEFTPPGPGWYQARLSIVDSGDARSRSANVLVLPERESERSYDEPRLGVSLTGWHPDRLAELEGSLALLDPAVIEVPLWPIETDDRPSIEGLEPLRAALDRQRFSSREVMVALDRLHGGLSAVAKVEPEAVLAALADDLDGIWRNALRDWMIRLGTSISRWRIPGGPRPAGNPALIDELVEEYVADPSILVSRPIDHPGRWGGDERYVISPADHSARVLSRIPQAELEGTTVLLSLPPEGWRERDRVDEAARRVIASWIGGAARILVPWRDDGPDSALLAWTGLSPVLGGRTFQGTLHVGEGNHCIVAGDERGPVLLAMTDLIDEMQLLRVPVGADPVEVVDLGGGVSEVRPRNGIAEIPVGSTPVAIFGADRLPVLVATSIRVEPDRVVTDRDEHQLEVVFENPTGRPLSGRLELDPPRGWSFASSTTDFTVGAFAEARIPVVLGWNRPPIVGSHRISGRIHVRGGSSLEIPIHLDLTLESPLLRVGADWFIARSSDPATAPIIVSVEIENIGDRLVDVEITTSGWRVARERRILTGLAPGTTRTRLMRLRAGLDRLAGTDVRVQVQELEGSDAVSVLVPVGGGVGPARGSTDTAVVDP
ncbi:MAG: hypothetical protein VX672_00275, partial [Planctomycetota bacterium]|nr:hypothetical protein [Planctomycetota bacterium]